VAEDRRAWFEAVFSDHFAVVLRYCASRADPEVAKDAVAETFLAAWNAGDRLPAEPRGWLLSVARRKIVDHYRGQGRRDAATAELSAHLSIAVPDIAEGSAERHQVRTAFATLSRADQEVLRLLAWDGLTHSEAAASLGCSVTTFAVRLHRARQRLRRALGDAESDTTSPGQQRNLAHYSCATEES
jgi:RNA polymerase sigma-70 factor (ECF subfamily)